MRPLSHASHILKTDEWKLIFRYLSPKFTVRKCRSSEIAFRLVFTCFFSISFDPASRIINKIQSNTSIDGNKHCIEKHIRFMLGETCWTTTMQTHCYACLSSKKSWAVIYAVILLWIKIKAINAKICPNKCCLLPQAPKCGDVKCKVSQFPVRYQRFSLHFKFIIRFHQNQDWLGIASLPKISFGVSISE